MSDNRFSIEDSPIVVEKLIKKVSRPEAGAITTFIGTVREWTNEKQTLYLKYEAYKPMAIQMFEQIEHEVNSRWNDIKIAISHRVGQLNIEDIAVVIAVSSPHREAAYQANHYIIERMKQIVPIWKKEHWNNGEIWVGDQLEQISYANTDVRKE